MSLLILGLGNPGSNFLFTRHNVGFLLLDSIVRKNGLEFKKAKRYEYAEFKVGFDNIVLVKPLTYMNLSGDVFPSVFSKFYMQRENLLVIVDNVDLALGKCRLRKSGSDSTHNGLRSISKSLGTTDYSRLYIGVGNQEYSDIKEFVLSKFSNSELSILDTILDFLSSEIILLGKDNFDEKILKINSSSFDVR